MHGHMNVKIPARLYPTLVCHYVTLCAHDAIWRFNWLDPERLDKHRVTSDEHYRLKPRVLLAWFIRQPLNSCKRGGGGEGISQCWGYICTLRLRVVLRIHLNKNKRKKKKRHKKQQHKNWWPWDGGWGFPIHAPARQPNKSKKRNSRPHHLQFSVAVQQTVPRIVKKFSHFMDI